MSKLSVKQETFPLKAPFKIAHGVRDNADIVLVSVAENNIIGYGESTPYQRYNETCTSVIRQIKTAAMAVNLGASTRELQAIMPSGAARNAIDCALWDLEAKQENKPLWEIANLPKPKNICTVFTLVIDNAEKLSLAAKEKSAIFSTLKLKLAGDELDKDRIISVHKAAPNTNIIIDANESWNKKQYLDLIKICQECNVKMIEQPFKAGQDKILNSLPRPITICADESCHVTSDLKSLVGKYDMVNIKLDKTGGLTEAITMLKKAKELNFKIMVGCMISTSLAIKPAYYLAQMADLVDIDAPILLKNDRPDGLLYNGENVSDS